LPIQVDSESESDSAIEVSESDKKNAPKLKKGPSGRKARDKQ